MSDDVAEREISAPVELTVDDGLVKLTFGPMDPIDLVSTIEHLGTPEGNQDFLNLLCDHVKNEADKIREQKEAAGE